MRLICTLSIVFVLGATSLAQANDPYVPQVVPQCQKYETKDGKEVCGYEDVEDWKTVLTADAELVHLRVQLKKEEKRTANLTLQVEQLESQVGACTNSKEILVKRNNKLTQDLIGLDKKYQNERVKPRWGSPLAWTIAGVSTSILAGIAVKSLLD